MNPSQPAFRKGHVTVANDNEAVGMPVRGWIDPAILRRTETDRHEV